MTKEKPETEEESSTGIPFLNAYGNVTKALERIITASTPQRFTHDFLQTKLNLKGGSARPIIPFLKRTGFINSDGSPTELYKQFRNGASRADAAAKAVRKGYAPLYEINEYVHDVKDDELKGIIVQSTGLSSTSSAVKGMIGSFKALKAFANFENGTEDIQEDSQEEEPLKENANDTPQPKDSRKSVDLKLGYTINLNLPPTSDVAVFDAIFKSLRKHLLDE